MGKNFRFIAIAGIILFIALSGCAQQTQQPPQSGNNDGTQTGNGETGAKIIEVTIKDFAYSPSQLAVNAGDTVKWTNLDSAPHTVTSDSGSELDSDQLNKGQSFSHTFAVAGTYDYHCAVHPSMKASVTVQ